jgi:rhodanese-related sulfurtransferase
VGQLAEFASNHPYLVIAVAVSLGAVLFYEIKLRSQAVGQLSVADAVRLINRGATIVDVRKPEEYGAGHIVNARNIPLGEIETDAKIVKKPKDKVLVTVCESGITSRRAAALLRHAGFENVFSLKGGIASWRADSLPLVK